MSRNEIETDCFLCAHPAVYREIDKGNRRIYACANPDCGDYEISRNAMYRLERCDAFRKRTVATAKQCREADQILEIDLNSHDIIKAYCKPKTS